MTKLLILETSARQSSISTSLAHDFADRLASHDDRLEVIRRVLSSDQQPNLDEAMTTALRAGVETPTDAQQAAISHSDTLIAELQTADMIVIAAPMHNFTISAQMRTWLDYVTRPGKTFGYTEQGPQGLLADKPVYIFSTRGGHYGDGSLDAPNPYDFQTGYLRHILGFIGLKSVHIIAANGMDMGEENKAKGLADAKAKTEALIASYLSDKAA